MPAVLVDIAQAVVEDLNAQPFSQAFTAVRSYVPRAALEDLDVLRVSVVPRSTRPGLAARGRRQREVAIDVGIQRRLADPDNLAEIDALVAFVEEVVDSLEGRRLTAAGAGFLEIENEPAVAVEHLDQKGVFTSVITVRYRAWR